MLKIKQVINKLFELIKKYYIFLFCVFFIKIGIDIINGGYGYWESGNSEGKIIGSYIFEGLKMVAGSILIAASLLSLTILKNNNK